MRRPVICSSALCSWDMLRMDFAHTTYAAHTNPQMLHIIADKPDTAEYSVNHSRRTGCRRNSNMGDVGSLRAHRCPIPDGENPVTWLGNCIVWAGRSSVADECQPYSVAETYSVLHTLRSTEYSVRIQSIPTNFRSRQCHQCMSIIKAGGATSGSRD